MSGWNALRRFLARNAEFIRHGSRHDIYLFRGRTIQVSRGSGSMSKGMWRHILKNELGITQEDLMQDCKSKIIEFTDGLKLWRLFGARVVLAEWGVTGAVLSPKGKVLRGWLNDEHLKEAESYTAMYFSDGWDKCSDITNLYSWTDNDTHEYAKALMRFVLHMQGRGTDRLEELRDNTAPLKHKIDSRIMKG